MTVTLWVLLFTGDPASAGRYWFSQHGLQLAKAESYEIWVSQGEYCDPDRVYEDVEILVKVFDDQVEVADTPEYRNFLEDEVEKRLTPVCGPGLDLTVRHVFPEKDFWHGHPDFSTWGGEFSRAHFLVDAETGRIRDMQWSYFDGLYGGGRHEQEGWVGLPNYRVHPDNLDDHYWGDPSLRTVEAVENWLAAAEPADLVAEVRAKDPASKRAAKAELQPRVASVVSPGYPWIAGLTRMQCGPTTLMVRLNRDGTVANAEVTQPSTGCPDAMASDFTREIERAVRKWIFDSPSRGGKAEKVWVRLQLTGETWPRKRLGGTITYEWKWELWSKDPQGESEVEDAPYSSGSGRTTTKLSTTPTDRIPVGTDSDR